MVHQWLKEGPDPEATGLSRWTLEDIRRLIFGTFAVLYTIEGVRLLAHRFDFRHLSPRPVHPKADVQRQEEFRNNFRELVEDAVPEGTALEVSVRSAGDDFCQSLSLRFQSLRSGCTQMSFLARAHSLYLS